MTNKSPLQPWQLDRQRLKFIGDRSESIMMVLQGGPFCGTSRLEANAEPQTFLQCGHWCEALGVRYGRAVLVGDPLFVAAASVWQPVQDCLRGVCLLHIHAFSIKVCLEPSLPSYSCLCGMFCSWSLYSPWNLFSDHQELVGQYLALSRGPVLGDVCKAVILHGLSVSASVSQDLSQGSVVVGLQSS